MQALDNVRALTLSRGMKVYKGLIVANTSAQGEVEHLYAGDASRHKAYGIRSLMLRIFL